MISILASPLPAYFQPTVYPMLALAPSSTQGVESFLAGASNTTRGLHMCVCVFVLLYVGKLRRIVRWRMARVCTFAALLALLRTTACLLNHVPSHYSMRLARPTSPTSSPVHPVAQQTYDQPKRLTQGQSLKLDFSFISQHAKYEAYEDLRLLDKLRTLPLSPLLAKKHQCISLLY